jgi:ribulose 1,5-bisphosphate synthetase/thiazole synthase
MKTIIIGGGAAGIAAAITAAKNGADTLLVESESAIGGDLFSGMPLLGAYTTLGECCVHGVLDEITDACKAFDPGGYIGPVCDWRTVYGLCLDPEILRLTIAHLLKKYNVRLLLNSTVIGVDVVQGLVKSLRIATRSGIHIIDCDCVVDASGGGNITAMAGGKVVAGDEDGQFQPMSLLFRMVDVQFEPLLKFIRDNPNEALLSENPVLKKNRAEAAHALYAAGYPYVAISAMGNVLGQAIKAGEVHPCTATFITPTSVQRGELCINATRIAGVDCTDDFAVSAVLLELSEQVANISRFLTTRIPGFEKASISSIAHRVGIRETGRIKGEYTLTQDDVVNATRHSDCIARGAHHVDIHGAGTAQVRIPVKDGLAYDIPYRCLIPQGIKNVIAAGRCLSSDRGANGSARVMGTCLATGQAAGLAAAIFSKESKNDFRNIETSKIFIKGD